ncbi:MAG: hypothetical protein KIT62_01680 [Cyclobacteriaceae bacterium]|nr:hypothetical protein [Cyclobacteriaceae bacterium]
MKNPAKLFFLFCLLISLYSCTEEKSIHEPTFESFKSLLHQDMTYSQLVKTFGEPARDIGSGIHIYVYPLQDDSEIWIGYSKSILYAYQVDRQGNKLATLIP